MKTATLATQNILAAGQYLKFEFYKFVLPKAGTFTFTNADASLTVGGTTYLTGLSITRTSLTQATGLSVQSVDLTIAPQADNPAGAVSIGGAPFLAACANGTFDGGLVTIAKGFFNPPAAGVQLDVSPGLVRWFSGIVDQVQVGRFSVDITINDTIQVLNTQMPKNIVQAGCLHTLFDAGCTLSKATYQVAASVTTGGAITARSIFASGLSQVAGYWALGIITFTSGVLAGSSYTIAAFASGVVTSVAPWSALPSIGDTFTILPGCDKAQATCQSSKFGVAGVGNIAHYRGAPYVPQPETLYDGGTSASSAPTLGGQGGQGAGSPFGGGRGPGTYKP